MFWEAASWTSRPTFLLMGEWTDLICVQKIFFIHMQSVIEIF